MIASAEKFVGLRPNRTIDSAAAGETPMRFGPRRPSLRVRIAARTSLKRYVRHSLGIKAPRGVGWLTNPKKAAYNRIYNRTTFDVFKLPRGSRRGSKKQTNSAKTSSVGIIFGGLIVIWI